MQPSSSELGIYVSYNQRLNGPFQGAVGISNTTEYVIWLDRSVINPERFTLPTTIVVRLSGEDRYYRGELVKIQRAQDVDKEAILAETTHRPAAWQDLDRSNNRDFQSVLYIRGLREVPPPTEVQDKHPPQHPYYVLFKEGSKIHRGNTG
jgi:hypothetical protein